jgi:uncharacterized protein YdhG (YjbR/CyaY superfamily)
MPGKKAQKKRGSGTDTLFSEEEKAAMRETVRERRSAKGANGEPQVLEKIRSMTGSDRVIAEKLHAIIKANAPTLGSRTWYGMPAYTKNEKILCHFQAAGKFGTRYATIGFSDESELDEGHIWPVGFAITELGPTEESRIIELLKRAIG